jgi:tRNA (guanine37-N1)-methyltransferase
MEVSIGDYILSGGEFGAMVLMDAVIRLLPGALGDESSATSDSFSAITAPKTKANPDPRPQRLLDCPHYTRPREWMGLSVPEVSISGNHQEVAKWRLEQMVARTRERRPDLLDPKNGK